jgi:hypothetical protein
MVAAISHRHRTGGGAAGAGPPHGDVKSLLRRQRGDIKSPEMAM